MKNESDFYVIEKCNEFSCDMKNYCDFYIIKKAK